MSSSVLKKTSAKPGALTGMIQALLVVSHGISTTFKSPLKRPSTSNLLPNVYNNINNKKSVIEIRKQKTITRLNLSSPSDIIFTRNGFGFEIFDFDTSWNARTRNTQCNLQITRSSRPLQIIDVIEQCDFAELTILINPIGRSKFATNRPSKIDDL